MIQTAGNIDKPLECHRCGAHFTVRQLIVAADQCYRSLAVVVSKTPCCQAIEELWLCNGRASRGYVYAAGQAHFADMEQYDAPDLIVNYSADQVFIQLGDYEKTLDR